MNKPKSGSRWASQGSHEIFRVLNIIEMNDGHIWVHYCKDNDGERNYSCYLESFLERFTETTV